MLTREELEKSPLFQGHRVRELPCRCWTAFRRCSGAFRVDEVIYDFSGPTDNAVGVVERGEASLIRIDEEGVSTVMEELGPGGVFGRTWRFPPPTETAWR